MVGILLISTDRPIEHWEQGLFQLSLIQAQQCRLLHQSRAPLATLKEQPDPAEAENIRANPEPGTISKGAKNGFGFDPDRNYHHRPGNTSDYRCQQNSSGNYGPFQGRYFDSPCHSFCLLENEKCPLGSDLKRPDRAFQIPAPSIQWNINPDS